MIKEIFDIEPLQKNTLIIFLGILSLSFLQIYLFEPNIIHNDLTVSIGLSISISVIWVLLNLPSLFFYFIYKQISGKNKAEVNLKGIIFLYGLIAIYWISLLTYLFYEAEIKPINIIRITIIFYVIKTFFWYFRGTIYSKKITEKSKKKE